MKKIFLTSATCMMAACPALAVVDNNNNQCIDTNLGTASGNAALEAIWGLNNYQCSGGQYFDTTNATCVQCTSNNYCPGGTYSVESQTNGLNACPNGYAMSIAGSDADTDCYRACTTTDVAHSTAVTGEYYYGDNNQCVPTSCAIGWDVINTDFTDSANIPSNPTQSAYAYVKQNGSTGNGGSQYTTEYYGLSVAGTWGKTFSDFGDIRGSAYCSAKSSGSNGTATMDELSSATGEAKYCWCHIDGLRPTGHDWIEVAPLSWVFKENRYSASSCADTCVSRCSYNDNGNSVLFDTVGSLHGKQCDLTDYKCSFGQYFDTTNAACVQCTSNNYCPGGTYNVESQTNGLNTCPNGYGLSVAGAGSENECYRTCTTGDVAHSLAVSGGYYYGDNNRCEATSCAAGWHVKSGGTVASIFASSEQTNSGTSTYGAINGSGVFNERLFDGTAKGQSYYGITEPNTWAVAFNDYGDFGMIRGSAYCSAKSANTQGGAYGNSSSNWTATMGELSSATGEARHCWCHGEYYKPLGNEWIYVASFSWVYRDNNSNLSYCEGNCAAGCAYWVTTGSTFRNVMFGTLDNMLSSCEANNIVINWYNEQILHDTNQCTYNETITLPEQPNKTGYTFSGWKIKAVPSNNN